MKLTLFIWSAAQVPAGWAGKSAAVVLFRSINHGTVFGQPYDTSQAERTAEDVLGQPLQACGVVRCEVHTVVNAEARVRPVVHLLGCLRVDFAFSDEQLKDFVLPNVDPMSEVDV